MQTLDRSVEYDARRMFCGVLAHFESTGEWPLGREVNQLGVYKNAASKTEAVQFMVNKKWLRLVEEPSEGGPRPRRRYVGTDVGRMAVMPPTPLPEITSDFPVPFPDDEVECALYGYHLSFWRTHGRWPRGLERAQVFRGSKIKTVSAARRVRAYEKLVEEGTFVNVTFWNRRVEYNCYVIPRYSPEYTDKHNWLYYAPLDKT
jgi:hypothetical protein